MAKISIDHVCMSYSVQRKRFIGAETIDTVDVLDDVSIFVDENEFVSIIGPSGCGKTTLLKMMAGLVTPVRGRILLDGKQIKGPNPKIAMVFQNILLLPWRTVTQNVELALELRHHRALSDEERASVQRTIEMVELKGFERYYPHQISGGMQQRVGLARALVLNPEVLLMDEPFGALDAQTRSILQDQLLSIREKYASTIIFVTHDLEEAIYLSDKVYIITKRPGKVKKMIEVELPKPRHQNRSQLVHSLAELREVAWQSLREEISIVS